ncbi:hypothetical protein MWU76_11525 [Gelidibacter sp. F2691]|nr:hypothetical protein [Gelidibacter sp. F2691]
MIKSIKLFKSGSERDIEFIQIHKHHIEIESQFLMGSSFTVQIEFNHPIIQFRNHDYTWKPVGSRAIANWYAPKILRLSNNQLVQANQHVGIWEINKKHPRVLLWHFSPKNANPLVQYGPQNSKQVVDAVFNYHFNKSLALLFPLKAAIEMSRSKIPFSAVVCFTDHCDFDTLDNLEQQRQFFKRYDLKMTKGFFLNHYSKRADTACVALHKDEFSLWIRDGHELAYHSLSQSIKKPDESIQDFNSFKPPFHNISVWIDHGYQPYNVSLFQNFEALQEEYADVFKRNSISTFWNYLDTGTAARGVINQLNSSQFTLNAYVNGIKHLKFNDQAALLVKNIIFHYYNDARSLNVYRNLAQYLKTFRGKKSFKKHFEMLLNMLKLLRLLIPIVVFWKSRKNKVYPLAVFTPVILSHDIRGHSFSVFQTLELVDFQNSLSTTNIDMLIEEHGLFIAHTYFSAPLNHHRGRLFGNSNGIPVGINENFEYLSRKIADEKIWNPTLGELIVYFNLLRDVAFGCNEAGKVIIEDEHQLPFKEVS